VETIQKLEKVIGGRWLGVSIHDEPLKHKEKYLCPQVDRFCEMFKIASVNKVVVEPEQFTCLGARYAFGWGNDLKETMIRKLVDTKDYTPACAGELIERTPHYQDGVQSISINVSKTPEMFVARLQPAQVMHLIQIYQKKLGKRVQTEMSSVISACGNVVVKVIQKQDIAISFGCDDSRSFGELTRDMLYAGLPYSQAKAMMD
jgi:uncharacterized protein (DUF169 family)